jgi:hypothetical protein
MMDRVAGIETEYGCLVAATKAAPHRCLARPGKTICSAKRPGPSTSIIATTKSLRQRRLPLNGVGFISTWTHDTRRPECLTLRDVVTYDIAGDVLLQTALKSFAADRVSFVEQRRSQHRGDVWLPRELSHEGGAIYAAGPRHLAGLPRDAADFHRRRQVGQANPLAFD